jgi:hypothetical protein
LSWGENGAHYHNISAWDTGHNHADNGHAHVVPAHGHAWNDSGHVNLIPAHGHGWNDNNHENLVPAHGHGLNWNDPGHTHPLYMLHPQQYGSGSSYAFDWGRQYNYPTDAAATGISASVAAAGAFWTGGVNVAVGSVANMGAFWSQGPNQAVGSVANAGAFWDQTGYASIAISYAQITANSDTQGSGTAHNTMGPFLTVNYVIKT